MDVLRVTLDSWRDLVSLTTPEGQTPGDTLSGGVTIDPSVTGPVVDSVGGIHHSTRDMLEVATLPWAVDLLDPTNCQPTGWGYRVTLSVRGAKPITCILTPERIAATPPVDGVRTMRLEDWAALGGALHPGVVTAGPAAEAAAVAVGAGNAAVTAAGQATSAATSAAGSASTAETAATSAAGSASTAETAAGQAVTAAGQAVTAAGQAASSATAALEARAGAEAARGGAVAARTGAEAARAEAEAFVSDASLDTAVADYLTVNPPPAGPSAYEVAVAAGYTGTETEWLASLKGEDGTPAPLPSVSWEGDQLRVGDQLSPSLTGPGGGQYDSGGRYIENDTTLLPLGGSALIRRQGNRVTCRLNNMPRAYGSVLFKIPQGFRLQGITNVAGSAKQTGGSLIFMNVMQAGTTPSMRFAFSGGDIRFHGSAVPDTLYSMEAEWYTTDAEPVTQPGLPDLYQPPYTPA